MARASIPTLLSLDQYAQIIGAEPHHFNGVLSAAFPLIADLDTVWYQHPYMRSGRVSREELAAAITQAERMLAEQIGFWAAPIWVEAEEHEWPQPRALPGRDLWRLQDVPGGYDVYGRRAPTVPLRWGQLRAPGHRVAVAVDTDVMVSYEDVDEDGFMETAIVALPGVDATGWAAEELLVTAPDAEAQIQNAIRPLRVTLGPTGITITGQSVLFIRPELWEASPAREGINGDVEDNYLATVDVYRVYTTTDGEDYAPVVLLYQDFLTATPPDWLATRGLMQPRNRERGDVYVLPVCWDADNATWVHAALTRRPDRALCYYRAGYPLAQDGRLDPAMARAVAALATALMSKMADPVGPEWNLVRLWQSEPENPPYSQMVCPWGRWNGAWEAYRFATNVVGDLGGLSL
jgi:hypothetical protein